MAKEALNRVKYKRFADQCRGAQISHVTVERQENAKQVLFRFNGRAPRGGKRLNGQWIISKKDREEGAVKDLEKAFMERIRKDFAIFKGGGFKKVDAMAEASAEAAESKDAEAASAD